MALGDFFSKITSLREAVAAGEISDGAVVLKRLEEAEKLATSRWGAVTGFFDVGKQGENLRWLDQLEFGLNLRGGRFAETPLAYAERLRPGIVDTGYLAANPQNVTSCSPGAVFATVDLSGAPGPVSFRIVAEHGTDGVGLTGGGMSTVKLTGIKSMGEQATIIVNPSDRTVTVIGQSVSFPVQVGSRDGSRVVWVERGESKTFHLDDSDEKFLIGIDQRVIQVSMPRKGEAFTIISGERMLDTNFKPRSPFQ